MLFRLTALFLLVSAPALAQRDRPNEVFDGEMEVIASGLVHPWSLAFLPHGDLLVTERDGRLRLITEGGLQPETVSGAPEPYVAGQGGMLDVVLHPAFETNGWIYLTYASGNRRANALEIARARYADGALRDLEVIFTANINKTTDAHYGGRMAFLPDGTFIVTIGEGFDYREQAQDPSNHLGTTVRLNDDGSIPDDNPVIEDGAPGVFSWGHRNPQAILHDSQTGRVISHEHGPRGGDELNVIEGGVNYGWPIATFGVDYSGAIISPFETYPGMRDPLLAWTPSIAPAGMTLYRGEMFPEWDGGLLIATLQPGDADTRSGHIRIIDMEDGLPVGQTVILGELQSRMRDVRTAPDGSVYVLTDAYDGAVIRLFR
ncbi:PQQ-dependent sugar dehydrogenase [Hyphobacterium sp. HN65]|uniref:PQQ-dependent sugar dehydrogenase n=1 Tax=Hyphobacterium lacteum TaxID=3116575 RepID=A0ABU7LTQ7_9PROT|nr:PQQ-dependent sugar dehydrogenase [Hyphobacterium sp. HN65]MEE2527286.1 PQQ-dependent sugar dehydrogenase [Hyphobacterium sp. HN65]